MFVAILREPAPKLFNHASGLERTGSDTSSECSSVRRRERVKRVRSGRSSSLVVVLLLNVVIVLFLHDLRINNDRGIDNDI